MSSKYCIFSVIALFSTASLASGVTIVHSDQSVSLSDLLTGQTISVGDKTFSDFTYSKVGDMPEADGINVIPIVSDGDYGVRFQGGFVDLAGGGASDSLITFSVMAPAAWIEGARLYGNVDASGNGIASITETFLPDLNNVSLSITAGVNLEDTTMFAAPVQTLQVQKDILLLADDVPATLSFVDQTFPQVPEPSTALLLSFGVLGLLGGRRRR